MAPPGTPAWRPPPTNSWHIWHIWAHLAPLAPQLELLQAAGPRPPCQCPLCQGCRGYPTLRSPSRTPFASPPAPPTGGTYLPLLRRGTKGAGHRHGAAGESRRVLARRGAAQRAAADAEGSPASASAPARLSPTSSRGPPKGPPREIGATLRAAASSRRAGPAKPRPPRRAAHHCPSPPPAPPIGRLPLWRHRGPAHPSVSMATGVNRGPHGLEARGMQGAELPENLEGLTARCLPALRTLEGVRQVGGFGEGDPPGEGPV